MPRLIPMKIPPGVNKDDTEFSQEGRYVGTQWVRFRDRRVQDIGGYAKTDSVNQFLGLCRGMLTWRMFDEQRRIAVGTHLKFYAYFDGAFTDITPLRTDGASLGNDPFAMTSGSPTVTVTHSNHGGADGTYVTYAGASAAHGLTISGEFPITQAIDANTYTITAGSNASSSGSGGGNSVTADYQINIGLEDSADLFGYGVGTYNSGTYGSTRSSSVTIRARTWYVAKDGEDILICPALGGSIYKYDASEVGPAAILANAPTNNVGMFATEQRHVMALGASGNKLDIKWSDDDDHTIWTAAATNTAGSKTLDIGNEIISGVVMRNLVSLVWTDTACWRVRWVGGEFIYDFRVESATAGLIAANAAEEYLGRMFWMGQDDFYMYDGWAKKIPGSEAIRDFVFGRLDRSQRAKCFAAINSQFDEVWFFYPNSTEIDSYVLVNTRDWSWSTGTIAGRTAWADKTVFDTPIAAGSDRFLYDHESGVDADGSALQKNYQVGFMKVREGDDIVEIVGAWPDFKDQVGNLTFTILTRKYPQSSDVTEETKTFAVGDEEHDLRSSGRLVAWSIDSNVVGGTFRAGDLVLDVQTAGSRR